MKHIIKLNKILTPIVLQLATIYSQNSLTIDWGISNGKYYSEDVTVDYDINWKPIFNKNYRYFTPTDYHAKILLEEFVPRQEAIWKSYTEQIPEENRSKQGFINYIEVNDEYLAGIAENLLPKIKFDFIGESKEYVLKLISIDTINYGESMGGGGFFDEKSSYGIELNSNIGLKEYKFDKKLRFTGSGETTLLFSSDNFSNSHGSTFPGTYKIDIKFIFFVDGEEDSVNTGAFFLDL